MKDTIVTAIYFSSPLTRMGGRGYAFEHYEAPFRNLLNMGCNIVVFSHEHEITKITNFFERYNFENYKIIDFDLNQYKNSDKIYELKEKSGLIDKVGLVTEVKLIANDRNHHLCLLKPFFIKYAIDNNLFESENYYWIDVGLFHHGIIPENFGGIEKLTRPKEENYWPILENSICNPYTLSKLENKHKTNLVLLGIDCYYGPTSWFHNYTESHKLTHIVGGLFGGKKEIILQLQSDFDELTTRILNDGNLTLEEEVLSILYTSKYKDYNYISFDNWYHDVPTVPNYFGISSDARSFYKIFI
jgi:hypothetical protein